MGTLNPDFWEIPTNSAYLEQVPSERALWFETEEDRSRRYALQDFFQAVLPVVRRTIDSTLTPRQREVVKLYYFRGKTQEDIAVMLALSQSTVSRHLFGTVRNGKKIGGAIPKLRRVIENTGFREVHEALAQLQGRFASSS